MMTHRLRKLFLPTVIMTGSLSMFSETNVEQVKQHSDGLVKVATACMRSQPAHSSEMVSQVVMGTPLRLIEKDDSWWLVESPEGYRGYVIGNGIQTMTPAEAHKWRESKRGMYTHSYTGRIVSSDGLGTPVSDIHAGTIIEITGQPCQDSIDVKLPDGRKGRLDITKITDLSSLTPGEIDTAKIIELARKLMGVAYLWGGTTTAGMDCSGLVKICYLNQGVILPRDASQQARTGQWLGDDYTNYQRGDLVFFKSATTGNIIHVGIYEDDGLYVHSSGRVKINSLDPKSPLYIPSNILAGACRITGQIGTHGIVAINEHPAYFNR